MFWCSQSLDSSRFPIPYKVWHFFHRKLILLCCEEKYPCFVRDVINENALSESLDAQQGVTAMADSGRRRAVSNLPHSGVSIELLMDRFPRCRLSSSPKTINDIFKENLKNLLSYENVLLFCLLRKACVVGVGFIEGGAELRKKHKATRTTDCKCHWTQWPSLCLYSFLWIFFFPVEQSYKKMLFFFSPFRTEQLPIRSAKKTVKLYKQVVVIYIQYYQDICTMYENIYIYTIYAYIYTHICVCVYSYMYI